MRIIATKSDYYDSAMSFGVDLTHIFNREQYRGQGFPLPDWEDDGGWRREPKGIYPPYKKEHNNVILTAIYVLLAGKLYGGIRIEDKSNLILDKKSIAEKLLVHGKLSFIWTKEELETSNYRSLWNIQNNRYKKYEVKTNEKNFKTACKVLEVKGDSILEKWAIENKITIAVFGSHTRERNKNRDGWTEYSEINPLLNEYEFQRVLDPFTVYQEIDMFISGILGNTEVIPEMRDKDKIVSHGFDLKTSFRKTK